MVVRSDVVRYGVMLRGGAVAWYGVVVWRGGAVAVWCGGAVWWWCDVVVLWCGEAVSCGVVW